MTRVDFYQIENDESTLSFACRLINKTYQQGHQIHVHAADAKDAQDLDDLIWQFRPEQFIPHACYDEKGQVDGDVRVQISHAVEPVAHRDILINLSGSVPEFFSRFERVAEIVPLNKEAREAARVNYKFYQDRGYPLNYHKIKGKHG